MKPLRDEYPRKIDVWWSRLRPYDDIIENGSDYDENATLYLIARRFGSAAPKIIYIGKTWSQHVSLRLTQSDHRNRRDSWDRQYPRQTLWVSCGIVSVKDGKFTRNRLDETERLLTYATSLKHTENRTNIWTHKLTDAYLITNSGSRCTMPRKVFLGVMTS